jgi:glycosyltransferase involved in cell wall biosynthesis
VETHLSDLTAVLERQADLRAWILCYKPIVTKVAGYLPRERRGPVSIRRYWWFGNNLFRRLEPWPALLFLYITPYFLLRSFFFMLAHARQVDVIHVHGFNMGFVGMVLGTVFRKRVVFQSHALYSFRNETLFAKIAGTVLRRMDMILALCTASKEEIVGLGISPEKILVCRHWINLELFTDQDRAGARARRGYGSAFAAFFVGRLIGIKGEEIVIRLAEWFPDVTFVVAGDGPGRGRVEEAAGRLINFRYIGLISNADLPDYYRAADVVLVPSQYPEGFGRVICEALACGTPVIASNIGGIPDAMDDTVGLLCGLSAEDFAAALERMVNAPDAYKRLKERARSYACERFSSENAGCVLASYREEGESCAGQS